MSQYALQELSHMLVSGLSLSFICFTNSCQSRKSTPSASPKSNTQPLLIPKTKAPSSRPSIAARTKDLRLKGSDLYVARLGTCHSTPPKVHSHSFSSPSSSLANNSSALSPASNSNSEPTSLYDELSPISRAASPSPTAPTNSTPSTVPEIRASRPCYRCVSAMHAVGIKRVFWSNAYGEWEGAKVRNLVESLEMGNSADEGSGGGELFITKHEVLMLKRTMGF